MIGQAEERPVARESAAAMRALWSALDAAAGPASTLATLGALVRALGASDYGILVIALAASGLSMAVNPAIAATTTRFVSGLRGQRHPGGRTVAGVITVSLITVAVIDLVLLLGTAVLNERLSRWVFGAAVASTPQVGQVLLLALLVISIQQIEAVLAAAIKGLEHFRRQALIEIFWKAILTAAVIIVAWHTRSLVAILIAQCAVYIASTLTRAVALRRLLPDRRLFALPGWAEASKLFRYGGWMWLTALAGVAYASADRIIIGRTLGAAAAGQYNIYVQITQLIHFVPSSVFAFSFPALSRLAAQGGTGSGEIARAYRKYFAAICATALGIAITMMLAWPLLLKIFARTGFDGTQIGAAWLLGLNFLLLACVVAPYYLMLALGHARVVSMISGASLVAALVLMVVLIPRYGLEGAAMARLAYGLVTLAFLERAHHHLRKADGPHVPSDL
jgi:O-antigen/teichoic acid export membrane protein